MTKIQTADGITSCALYPVQNTISTGEPFVQFHIPVKRETKTTYNNLNKKQDADWLSINTLPQ